MEKVSLILILLLVVAACYIIYDSMPSKLTKLDENFGGFKHRSVLRFEFEKSLSFIVLLVRENLFC